MFIRANKRGNKVYYYIVKSERSGAKINQKVVLYLGTAETLMARLNVKEVVGSS